MLRRTRPRATAVTGVLLLALGGLAACGEDEGPGASGAGLESVTIEGDPGKEPKVTFDGEVSVAETEKEVVAEGDGEAVEDGDSVLAHIWIGNGFTQEQSISTWESKKPELLTVDDNLSPAIKEGVADQAVGSRVAIATPAEEAYGEGGNPQLGIGNKDSVIFVIDVVGKIGTEPHGEDKTPARWAPTLVEEDGKVTGFDFSQAHKPGGKLLETTLVKGDGPVVEKGQTIYVNYLGQVYEAEKPFDDSYSKGTPASFPIGVGSVVKGWDQALVGKPVGSRVILEIPPALGYGKAGNEGAGIKGTDTLFFVVDILGAA